jgi:hypothetical protein
MPEPPVTAKLVVGTYYVAATLLNMQGPELTDQEDRFTVGHNAELTVLEIPKITGTSKVYE